MATTCCDVFQIVLKQSSYQSNVILPAFTCRLQGRTDELRANERQGTTSMCQQLVGPHLLALYRDADGPLVPLKIMGTPFLTDKLFKIIKLILTIFL